MEYICRMPGYLCVFQTSRLKEKKNILGKVIHSAKNTTVNTEKKGVGHQGLLQSIIFSMLADV